jgi:hypothetical protein
MQPRRPSRLHEFLSSDQLSIEWKNIHHCAVVAIGEAAHRIFDGRGIVAHVGRALDGSFHLVLDALAADIDVADIVRAQDLVETVPSELSDLKLMTISSFLFGLIASMTSTSQHR